MAKVNLGVLEFRKSIAGGSQKEKSKQGVDMIITPHPVVTITIMNMLSISAWMTKSSWVWGTNIGKLSKINELHSNNDVKSSLGYFNTTGTLPM